MVRKFAFKRNKNKEKEGKPTIFSNIRITKGLHTVRKESPLPARVVVKA